MPRHPLRKTSIVAVIACAVIAAGVWRATVNAGVYNGYRLDYVPNPMGDRASAVAIDNLGRVSLHDLRTGDVRTPTSSMMCDSYNFAFVDKQGDICTAAPLVWRKAMTKNGNGILIRRNHVDTILPDPGVGGPDGNSDIVCGFSGRYIVLWSMEDERTNSEYDGSRRFPLPCPASKCRVTSVNSSGDAAGLIADEETDRERTVVWHKFRPTVIKFPVSSVAESQYTHSCVIGDDGTVVLSTTGTGEFTTGIFVYRDGRIQRRVALPPGRQLYTVTAVNARGDFVGTTTDFHAPVRAFVCRSGVVKLLTAPGVASDASAINDHGVVAGDIYTPHASENWWQVFKGMFLHPKPRAPPPPFDPDGPRRPVTWTPLAK